MSKETKIIIGIAVVGVLALVALIKPTSFGGIIHNATETFTPGIRIGDAQNAACIITEDSDKGGYSYTTVLNGTMTTTGGTAGAFAIPDACAGK